MIRQGNLVEFYPNFHLEKSVTSFLPEHNDKLQHSTGCDIRADQFLQWSAHQEVVITGAGTEGVV